MIQQEGKNLIMILVLLDGENKMILNIGLFEIHGVLIGEKKETSDLFEDKIT